MHFSGLATLSFATAASAAAQLQLYTPTNPPPHGTTVPAFQPFVPYPSDPDCTAKSQALKEVAVSNFNLYANTVFSSPTASTRTVGELQFTIGNNAISSFVPFCNGTSVRYPDFFSESNPAYSCVVPTNAGEVSWTFDRPSSRLSLNQTWFCTDTNPQQPTTFRVTGSGFTALNCTDTQLTFPATWQQTGQYSNRITTCQADTFVVPVSIVV